jgi:hypothetical protein
MDEVVADVIKTCSGESGKAVLDVVVATHRHQDHIRGFGDERWQQVEVREVWLPWTEDPSNAEANGLRARDDSLALSMAMALQADGGEEGAAFALNSLTNEDAMWTLRNGFVGDASRRYVVADPATPYPVSGLPGGTVYFLSPSLDVATLRKMEAPATERWLEFDAAVDSTKSALPPAFPSFTVSEDQVRVAMPDLELKPRLREKLAGTGGQDARAAAASLDQALNNTSVVILLKVGDVSVLLPGDAQWGAWLPLLDKAEVRALLGRVSVYKVSHHGSHNGTPRSLVEDVLGDAVTSLVSVRRIERWADIPKADLMDALRTGGRRLLSSDGTLPYLPEARADKGGLWYEVDVGA